MTVLTMKDPKEGVHINVELITTFLDGGPNADQDNDVFYMIEQLAEALGETETHFHNHDVPALRRCNRNIEQIAQNYGFVSVCAVARDVEKTIEQNDWVALGAVLHRMLRLGEQSLYAIWDLPKQTCE